MGEREPQQTALDIDPHERLLDDAPAAHGDGRESHDVGARLDETAQATENVVGHTRARMRER